ncbi:MAG: efflux RND transporter periplasmic adaptor subunit [Planctomycetes bacterium]|nr:efflux RND transporter periplasmic adaptor subunit [Planctomycetota bacterium]
MTSQTSSSPMQRLSAARGVVEIPIKKRAVATSLIEGRVIEILDGPTGPLHEGISVRKGQVLARVRSQKLRSMQLEFLQAVAGRIWARGEVKRLKNFKKTGGAAGKEFDERDSELKRLETQVASLARRLKLIGLSRKHVESLEKFDLAKPVTSDRSAVADPIVDAIAIRAPITGRISKYSVSPGELVHAHDKLFEIQNTDYVRIKAYYFERDAARIKVDQNATVTFPANPQLRLQGKVELIAPQLESKDRVLPVWIKVPNPENFLKEGMLAEVVVEVPTRSSTLVVRKVGK